MEKANVDTVCTIWSTSINVREQQKSAKSKNSCSCLGVQTQQRSRRKCCTHQASMHSRNHSLEYINMFKLPTHQKPVKSRSWKNFAQPIALNVSWNEKIHVAARNNWHKNQEGSKKNLSIIIEIIIIFYYQ